MPSVRWVKAACKRCQGCRSWQLEAKARHVAGTLPEGGWLVVIEDTPAERRKAQRRIKRAGGGGYIPVLLPESKRALFTSAEVPGSVWLPAEVGNPNARNRCCCTAPGFVYNRIVDEAKWA